MRALNRPGVYWNSRLREKYPRRKSVEEGKEIVRNALRELKPVKVLIPYADYV